MYGYLGRGWTLFGMLQILFCIFIGELSLVRVGLLIGWGVRVLQEKGAATCCTQKTISISVLCSSGGKCSLTELYCGPGVMTGWVLSLSGCGWHVLG